MQLNKPDTKLWAKTCKKPNTGETIFAYPVIAHLLDTAAATQVLWEKWLRADLRKLLTETLNCTENAAKNLVAYAAGVHDIGKINPAFQSQLCNKNIRQNKNIETIGSYKQFFENITKNLVNTGYLVDKTWLETKGSALKRHEKVSYYALTGKTFISTSQIDVDWLAATATGHHGKFSFTGNNQDGLPGCTDEQYLELFAEACAGNWGIQQQAHIQTVAQTLTVDPQNIPPLVGDKQGVALLLLSGLVNLADWVASEELAVLEGMQLLDTDPKLADPKSWVATQKTWFEQRIQKTLGVYTKPKNSTKNILGSFVPSSLQKSAQKVGDGLWMVAFPTGDGKTEAALLRHMERDEEGIIFALPTRATADVMMHRFCQYFAGENNVANLLHGFSVLHPFYTPQMEDTLNQVEEDLSDPDCNNNLGTQFGETSGLKSSAWYKFQAQALLTPVAVATCDQVLVAALPQKWLPLRLLALANHHVVLDEVHTYDVYQSELLEVLLFWWGQTNTRVTLLSATLPTAQRDSFAQAYLGKKPAESLQVMVAGKPLGVPQNSLTGNVVVFPGHYSAKNSAQTLDLVQGQARYVYDQNFVTVLSENPAQTHVGWLVEKSKQFPQANVGVMVNQVDVAIKVAQKVEQTTRREVVVLHSRMVAQHRLQVTENIVARIGGLLSLAAGVEQGLLLVGTQVLEASLNVDLDFLSTDLAPLASVLQRCGRCWRFKDDPYRSLRVGETNFAKGSLVQVVAAGEQTLTEEEHKHLPYLVSQQKRAWHTLQTHPIIQIPTNIQPLIDQNHQTFDELFLAQDDKHVSQELEKNISKLRKAKELVLSFAYPEDILEPKFLSWLTSGSGELSTRFLDVFSEEFILFDPEGEQEYVLAMGFAQLAVLCSPGYQAGVAEKLLYQQTLQKVLGAVVPVNGKYLQDLESLHKQTLEKHNPSLGKGKLEAWDPVAKILRYRRPVDVGLLGNKNLQYSSVYGLCRIDGEKN